MEMDNQIICPRPTVFGEIAWLIEALALGETQFEDFSRLINHRDLPKDAEKTWRLP